MGSAGLPLLLVVVAMVVAKLVARLLVVVLLLLLGQNSSNMALNEHVRWSLTELRTRLWKRYGGMRRSAACPTVRVLKQLLLLRDHQTVQA